MRRAALFTTLLTMVMLPAAAADWSLQKTLEHAATASPALQQARLRALEQDSQALVTRAGLGPQVGISLSQSYQTSNLQGIGITFPGVPSRIGPYRVMDARPRLTQTVLDMSLLSRYRAERARAGQLKEDAAALAEQTRLAVIDLYLQALESGSRARAAKAREETAQAVWKQTLDAEEAGTGNKLEVVRAAQRLESERTAGVLAKRDREVLLTLLKKTAGLEQAETVELAELVAGELPALTVEDALKARPEMRALDAKGRALEADRVAVQRERWPRVTAFGDFGALGADPTDAVSTYTVGVSVQIPVWTSGRISNEVKAAAQRIEQWEQEKRALRLQVSQELTRAALEREAAAEAEKLAGRAAAAAREVLELSRLRYGAGLTGSLDVATAQGNLALAEEEAIRTRYQSLTAAARMAAAQGNVMAFLSGR
ncbi:MAG: TolC family protein [Acidobacteria bacterium]|nr:TolC family protein [Acidobacteriota bacterium]